MTNVCIVIFQKEIMTQVTMSASPVQIALATDVNMCIAVKGNAERTVRNNGNC